MKVNDLPPEERNVAYLPQQYALFPHMTVLNNVAFGLIARGIAEEEALNQAHNVLDMVKLGHRANALPRDLSGGMQQRVALARALASRAKLLLLDEPLGALDARLRVELRYRLKSLVKSADLTAIHVTHDQREAMIVADRIVVLRAGRVEEIGTPYHIYQRPDNLFVANFVGETNFLEGLVKEVTSSGSSIELRNGLIVRIRDISYLPGERVTLAIRQELTSVKNDDENNINVFTGEIRAARFLGDSIRVEVRLANGDHISARVPLTDVVTYPKPGEKIDVSFKPEDVAVFSAPPRGLAKEIEVV
jgi:ABC-type Fe3+/spermidine/putrescine transport system ATPase subunit